VSDVPSPGSNELIAGRYRLGHRLAAGGMASVWQATDTVLEREVAVKILHPHLAADATFVARFRAEAISAARLRHPNIVAIYDTCSQDGTEAIVMELVRGRTLRAYLDEHGPLVPAEAVHIVAEAAGALSEAHRAGIVHRDVKPANILIRDDGQVLVTDFGIAKLRSQPADLTHTGMMIGSVRYLSPEQVEGTEIDARTDVYALGIVLFECLLGRVPFQADTDAATALARLRQPPPRPRQLRPELSPGLEAVVLRALARERDQRYATADDLRAALLGAPTTDDPTIGQPVPAAPPTPPPARPAPARPATPPPKPRARPPARRRRRWWIPTVLVVVIASALGLAAVLFGQTEVGQDLFDQIRGEDDDEASADDGDPGTTSGDGDPPGGPGEVVAVVDFDPLGDGGENPEALGALTDASGATAWTTECYSTPELGGVKPGVGLLIERPEGSTGGTLEVRSPTQGWSAQVFVGDDPAAWRVDAGPGGPVAEQGPVGGDASFGLGDAAGRYVLLWVTHLGEGGCDGEKPFRVEISELSLS
jgi:serine/threonine-protein kinase